MAFTKRERLKERVLQNFQDKIRRLLRRALKIKRTFIEGFTFSYIV